MSKAVITSTPVNVRLTEDESKCDIKQREQTAANQRALSPLPPAVVGDLSAANLLVLNSFDTATKYATAVVQ